MVVVASIHSSERLRTSRRSGLETCCTRRRCGKAYLSALPDDQLRRALKGTFAAHARDVVDRTALLEELHEPGMGIRHRRRGEVGSGALARRSSARTTLLSDDQRHGPTEPPRRMWRTPADLCPCGGITALLGASQRPGIG